MKGSKTHHPPTQSRDEINRMVDESLRDRRRWRRKLLPLLIWWRDRRVKQLAASGDAPWWEDPTVWHRQRLVDWANPICSEAFLEDQRERNSRG